MKAVPIVLVVLAATVNHAAAQSFDCRKARMPDEIAVCNDPLLSELDDIQAEFYRRLRHYSRKFDNAMGLQAQLRDEARVFLQRRAECGTKRNCLEGIYRARIRELLERWMKAFGDDAANSSPGKRTEGRRKETPAEFSCGSLELWTRPAHRVQCPDAPDDPSLVGTWRLGNGMVACAVPCFMGAYNIITRVYLVEPHTGKIVRLMHFPAAGRDGRMMEKTGIVSPAFDPKTRTLTSFNRARGLGDCGERFAWRWDGSRFRLIRQQVKDRCDGRTGPWQSLYPR